MRSCSRTRWWWRRRRGAEYRSPEAHVHRVGPHLCCRAPPRGACIARDTSHEVPSLQAFGGGACGLRGPHPRCRAPLSRGSGRWASPATTRALRRKVGRGLLVCTRTAALVPSLAGALATRCRREREGPTAAWTKAIDACRQGASEAEGNGLEVFGVAPSWPRRSAAMSTVVRVQTSSPRPTFRRNARVVAGEAHRPLPRERGARQRG
jgi:hypothetical protein